MGARSKIDTELPRQVREELDARLVAQNFCKYADLHDWLARRLREHGLAITISRPAVKRHGKRLESRLQRLKIATEQAKALAAGAGDDEGAMSDALVRLTQERLFELLMSMGDIDPKKVNLSGLLKGVSEITKASVSQKRWMTEARAKISAAKADLKKELQGRKGITADTMRKIDEAFGVLG